LGLHVRTVLATVWGSAILALGACSVDVSGKKSADASVAETDAGLSDASTAADGDAATTNLESDASPDRESGVAEAGENNDASSPSDDASPPSGDASASNEAGPPADAGCQGVICGGSCLNVPDCSSCPQAPILCGSQCVSGCGACADGQGIGKPIECFACDANHANPVGSCQYFDAGSYCLNGDYTAAYHGGNGYRCACKTLNDCPGPTQICAALGNVGGSFCLSCGETSIQSTQGLACKLGGTCHASRAQCQ
jgi:hypothetical protein